jgi:hypothetical protein
MIGHLVKRGLHLDIFFNKGHGCVHLLMQRPELCSHIEKKRGLNEIDKYAIHLSHKRSLQHKYGSSAPSKKSNVFSCLFWLFSY